MAPRPRALLMLTCFSDDAVNVAVPAKENARGSSDEKRQRRRWTGEIKRKILAATRRPRIWTVTEEQEPCDVDVEKQKAQAQPETKAAEQQATSTPRRDDDDAPVLQSDKSPSNGGAPDAVAVDGRRKRKGLRVRFDLTPQEIITAPAPPVQPRFPTGVLGEPPGSFAHSGADMTAAFLMSVIAEKKSRGTDSAATQVVDRGLVACWTERKAACSRRLSYLRDYCPFQREEEEEAEDDRGEESEPETTTTRPEAESGHEEEVRPVKTGLPFDSPESEAEFVKAIRSRYLRKDDFLLGSRERHSLMAAVEVNV